MPTPFVIGGLFLMAMGAVCSRLLAERAMKLLSATEKLTLLDSFSRLRVFGALPLLFVFFCFAGVAYLPAHLMLPGYLGVWFLVAVYFVIFDRVVSHRLRALGINLDYQKAQVRVRWLYYSGFLALFILATAGLFVPK